MNRGEFQFYVYMDSAKGCHLCGGRKRVRRSPDRRQVTCTTRIPESGGIRAFVRKNGACLREDP